MIPNLTLNFKNIPALTVVVNNIPTAVKTERIYAIDWLRVIAFGIVMFYHTAEVFSTDKWYIKNEETSYFLSLIMLFFHEWRLTLLFVISGAAIQLAYTNKTFANLLRERTVKILVPLLAGMILVIPPQMYFIRLYQGQVISFWDFYTQLLNFQWYPSGDFHWLHLWYMAFLFVFTVALLPLLTALKTAKAKKIMFSLSHYISNPLLLFSLVLVMDIPFFLIKYLGPGGNLAELAMYFPYYVFGALFLTTNEIRSTMIRLRRTSLKLSIIAAICLYALIWVEKSDGQSLYFLNFLQNNLTISKTLIKSLNHWFWVLTIIGYGLRYLTEGSPFLTYANKAIAPFYILHQTVIVVVAYYTVTLPYNVTTKFYLILSITFIGIMLLYHFVLSRTNLTRLIFGIKK